MLVNDGSESDGNKWAAAPFELQTADYAVEAEIQLVRWECNEYQDAATFGLVAREGYRAGYAGRFSSRRCGDKRLGLWTIDWKEIKRQLFPEDTNFHIYRLEVKGNTIKFFVDGEMQADAIDNRYLVPGRVGVWSRKAQINIRSFKVIAL